jgi:hypothetical protein
MTKPIERVLAEAEERLRLTGQLDREAILSAYPEHESELPALLETMELLHQEKAWLQAESRSRAHALSLFQALTSPATEAAQPGAPETVADLFAQDRAESGLNLAQQANRSGLPEEALRRLAEAQTPLEALKSNAAIKALAEQVRAPFAALAKEVRRLLSIQSLTSGQAGAVFTRHAEASSEEEHQALLEKVRREARRGQEDAQADRKPGE